MKFIYLLLFAMCTFSIPVSAQKNNSAYTKSIKAYQENYINTHEVVKEKDRKYFRFFPISNAYQVNCNFEKITDSTGFTMKTSGNGIRKYFKYGKLSFSIRDTALQLFIYQSEDLLSNKQYSNYLFVPFTDLTTGDESYGSGRYIEFYTNEIISNKITIDFNKSYNPYCAYVTGYRCPIPPKENNLPVAIKAGEMIFGKTH